MKVAHITINYNPNNALGIINTLNSKKAALQNIGADFYDFYFINDFKTNDKEKIKFIKIPQVNLLKSYKQKFFYKFQIIEDVINLSNYDKIIIRYPLADKSGVDFAKNNKVIIEDHSIRFTDLNSSLKLSQLKYPLIYGSSLIRKSTEKKYGLITRNLSSGIISVTNEIQKYNLIELNNEIPKVVISNGIDSYKIIQTRFKQFDGKELNMILVASKYSNWHGIERLFESMDNYAGSIKLFLNIVGDLKPIKFKFKDNKHDVKYHSVKNGAELDELFELMNLGIGTLGLFKKGMNEACPLKVKEYCSRGIPFIKAYQDTDIDRIDDFKDFYLNFPNDNSLINFEKVIDFISLLSKDNKSVSERMHDAAVKHLDWKIKMLDYHRFVEKV